MRSFVALLTAACCVRSNDGWRTGLGMVEYRGEVAWTLRGEEPISTFLEIPGRQQ